MTREEAIEVLKNTEDNINYDTKREEIYFTHKWVGAYEMALAALREKDSNANQRVSNTSNALERFNQKTEADTVKGCKLCNSARFDIAVQTRDPDDMYVFSSDPVIGAMFCPLCGRRLE